MKDANNNRDILRRLLHGRLTAEEAVSQFKKAHGGIVVITHPNGLHSIGNDTGLTEEQVQERAQRASVVYWMPDNGRA